MNNALETLHLSLSLRPLSHSLSLSSSLPLSLKRERERDRERGNNKTHTHTHNKNQTNKLISPILCVEEARAVDQVAMRFEVAKLDTKLTELIVAGRGLRSRDMDGSIAMGVTPIAGWFLLGKIPSRNG